MHCTLIYIFCVTPMQEKDASLSSDYGKDLASVQALQRKHEGFQVRANTAWDQDTYVHVAMRTVCVQVHLFKTRKYYCSIC